MWPPEALDFLRELEDNNDRDWFKANRARYDQSLAAPARELAERLSHLGQPHFFRPYNNLRFRPGPPLKEHIGVAIGYGAAGGYYVELSLDGLLVAGGLYRPAPDQLERFRAAITEARMSACSNARLRVPSRLECRWPSPSSSARLAATRTITHASVDCG